MGDDEQKWVENEKSWSAYQGLSVIQRLEKIKGTLKDVEDKLSKLHDSGDSKLLESIMMETIANLHIILPDDLQTTLPWSALINLINNGLRKIGWTFMGPQKTKGVMKEKASTTGEEYIKAISDALNGVAHWLPDKALDHSASSTTADDANLERGRQALNLEDYQAMWHVHYPEEAILRTLDPHFPRRPYKARDDEESKAQGFQDVHWGQRKLFMNELELLTLYGEAGDLVVYAGAAPGRHIAHLAYDYFPEISFVLVDPAPFWVKESEKIKLVKGLMTDELAREYAGRKNVIFISDIRRTYASEDLILEDMLDQQRWHEIMRPKVSMLKFRLPWRPGQTDYLDGQVYTQPYAKPRSTETRLIVRGWHLQEQEEEEGIGKKKSWDHQCYEEQCFFFNTIVRRAEHRHGVPGAGLPPCWDHAAEVEIWRQYKLQTDAQFAGLSRDAQNLAIGELSVRLTKKLEGAQSRLWLSRVDWKVYSSSSNRRRGRSSDSDGEHQHQHRKKQRREREA